MSRDRCVALRMSWAGESGRYEYGYDALARLESVTRNGERLRSYAYDSFGNRTGMEDYEAGKRLLLMMR